MNFDYLQSLVNDARARTPVLFGLDGDPPAVDADILEAEALLGVEFPVEYKIFVKEFGGGYFGYTNVFSPTTSGYWSIVERNRLAGENSGDFLAFSDNGVGDYYGFVVEDGVCSKTVYFFDHETSDISESGYADLFDYLADVGLKARL